MTKYEIFEKIIQAYKSKNDAAMNFYTNQLLAQETENPYKLNYEEAALFAPLPTYYKQSQSGRVGSRKATVDISRNMKKILSISTMNPYSDQNFFNKENTGKEKREEIKEESKPVKHVFGVIPVENEVKIEEDKKEQPKKLFNKRKKKQE